MLGFEPATVDPAATRAPDRVTRRGRQRPPSLNRKRTGVRGRARRKDVIMRHDHDRAGRGRHGPGSAGRIALQPPTSASPPRPGSPLVAGHLTVDAQMRAERRELAAAAPHAASVARLARKLARVKRRGLLARRRAAPRCAASSPAELRDDAPPRAAASCAAPGARDAPAAAASSPPASPHLEAIAACESGGNPATDTGNGFYGKYQFTLQTWAERRRLGQPGARLARPSRTAAPRCSTPAQGASPWPGLRPQ